MEALSYVRGGDGSYIAIRIWETKLMLTLRMAIIEYSKMPIRQRTRLICAMMLDKWMETLAVDKAARKGKQAL